MKGFQEIDRAGLRSGDCFRVLNCDGAFVFIRRWRSRLEAIQIAGKDKNMFHIFEPDTLVKRMRVATTARIR